MPRVESPTAALIGPIVTETIALWGVPGVIALLGVAAVIWWTKATAGLRTEMADTITRLDARVKALGEERDAAVASMLTAREESYKWRESYYAIKYPGSDHEDVAGRTGMDKEQDVA